MRWAGSSTSRASPGRTMTAAVGCWAKCRWKLPGPYENVKSAPCRTIRLVPPSHDGAKAPPWAWKASRAALSSPACSPGRSAWSTAQGADAACLAIACAAPLRVPPSSIVARFCWPHHWVTCGSLVAMTTVPTVRAMLTVWVASWRASSSRSDGLRVSDSRCLAVVKPRTGMPISMSAR